MTLGVFFLKKSQKIIDLRIIPFQIRV